MSRDKGDCRHRCQPISVTGYASPFLLRARLGWLVLLSLLSTQASCGPNHHFERQDDLISGPTMGTAYHIRVAALPANLSAETLQTRVDQLLDTINQQMSTYLDNSEISRFNRSQSDEWFSVSPDTALVVGVALEVSGQTEGAFDVTVGPLVNLWGFGPDKHIDRVPDQDVITAARARVGYDQLEVRRDPPALRKHVAGLYVDLSAIAKGFAVDRVAELLQQAGISDYMVEIGGEIITSGQNASGKPWRIGIERPVDGSRSLQRILELRDEALATSGDYRNFFIKNGQRFSHAIDPRTGWPVDHALASTSVIAEDCMRADAWATALMVLGPEAAFTFAQEHGLEVMLIIRHDGNFVEKVTPGFARRFSAAVSSP
jgi:thiamine biosynthesis lipoprotein